MMNSNSNYDYDSSWEASNTVENMPNQQLHTAPTAKIIPFPKRQVESVKLQEWLDGFRSDEELREVFLNMDLAMKYIHEKDYCIQSFHPKKIEILNNSLQQIRFDELMEMPNNFDDQKELIHEDIYSSAFLQIAIYLKCLDSIDYLNPAFLKENFSEVATFLPEGDVPYYKGVMERGASVYFSSYIAEKKKRDLQVLETEFGEGGNERGKSLVKSNGKSISAEDMFDQNKKINESIYSQLAKQDAAFVHFLIYPTIVILVGLTIMLLISFTRLF